MPRTSSRRTALAAAAVVPPLPAPGAAGPARAHGAPTDPVSRPYACSPEGGEASRSRARRAAVASNGAPFTAWDDQRIANVNGRDSQVVPDGRLCSGGAPAHRGLDLARTGWPATPVSPGATPGMCYDSTIATNTTNAPTAPDATEREAADAAGARGGPEHGHPRGGARRRERGRRTVAAVGRRCRRCARAHRRHRARAAAAAEVNPRPHVAS